MMMMLLYLGRRRRRRNDAGDEDSRKVSLVCGVWCAEECCMQCSEESRVMKNKK